MDSELKQTLDEIRALAKDNHKMLRAIRRGQWLSGLWTIIIWAVAISLPLYLYQQYVQPLVSKYQVSSGISTTTPSTWFGESTFAELQKLISSGKAGQ
jgi:hypothetical protein